MRSLIPTPPPSSASRSDLDADWRGYVRLGWLVLLGGFGAFLVWAIFAPLDKGVPVNGTVIVSGQRLSIQSPNAGVVDKILVKEGQRVSAGTIMMRLQPRQAEAAADSSLSSYALSLLTRERLMAELAGRKDIHLPAALARYSGDSVVQQQLRTQAQLLSDRLRTRASELSALNETIRGLEQQRIALEESWVSKDREAKLLDEQARRVRSLADKGFASPAMLDDTELKKARLQSDISENRGVVRRIEAQIAETKLTKDKREGEWQQEIKARLADVQRDIENFRGQLGSAELNLSYMDVKAPISGSVLGLAITSPGAVLAPGQKLLDIVPERPVLVIEAQVPVNLIDQIHAGLPVELNFSAFQQNKTPRLKGRVAVLGADRITDPKTGMPYFPVSVTIDGDSAPKLGANELRPGMPVDVFIKTGERTFISYLLKPLSDRLNAALAEE
jgi:protease secretion system membrane fusion protein